MALTSEITAYDPRWPGEFEKERVQLAATLGDLAREIHHVGSTAIPGIKAKPEIDVLIVIGTLDDIDAINAGMAELGYDVRGDDPSPGRHYYSKDTPTGIRTHKAHVCERSHDDLRWMLAFRDYMRDHPKSAREYTVLKLQLAKTNTAGMAEYVAGKHDYIRGIIARALAEGYGI